MTETNRRLSPLRRRMIDDMTVRNLSPATQRSYLHAVAKFSRYFERSPDRLDIEDVRTYQVYLVSQGISWPSLNQKVCALRFFYGVTLGRNEMPPEKRLHSILGTDGPANNRLSLNLCDSFDREVGGLRRTRQGRLHAETHHVFVRLECDTARGESLRRILQIHSDVASATIFSDRMHGERCARLPTETGT